MRLAYYAGASTAAAAACLLKAFHERPNFYSATVYLSQSNACLLIITNLLLVCTCAFMYVLQRLLYGPLRPSEIEHLSEKAWYAVLDTLLAMPSFREDVGGWLLTMFVLLLAGKVWGWIGEGRVDILEQQPPANPRLFHARLATSLIVSVVFDIWMAHYCFETVAADPRPGMMVIFTFEFAIQCVFSCFTLSRYLLSAIAAVVTQQQMVKAIEEKKNEIRAERAAERQNETADGRPAPASAPSDEPVEVDENEVDVPGWEERRRWLFGLEVLSDFLKLLLYVIFFIVSITFNGLPMHIMRDVYMTFSSFSKRINDYMNYKKATSDMNTRYPDATTEEIRGDACIVCREDMLAWAQPDANQGERPADQAATAARPRMDEGLRAKKLPCGHILHLRCLKAWLERQQVCPTCRRPVISAVTTTAAAQAPAGGDVGNGQPADRANANPAPAPARQRQQQGPGVQNRARFFRFGPIRVGFLNGPAGQMNNILEQLQNGQRPPVPAQQPAPAQVAEQGPNHLGLQVPYVTQNAGDQATPTMPAQGQRAVLPTQVHIAQIEQRLLQEANNLNIDQAQLTTLRMMERELARLRTLHMPTQAVFPTAPFAPGQAHQIFQAPALNLPALTSQNVPPQGGIHPQPAEVLRGNPEQQLGSGHSSLPSGVVLPEGWTIMPLHRDDPSSNQAAPIQPEAVPVATQNHASAQQSSATQGAAEAPTSDAGTTQTQASQLPTERNTGPTDERGSPLFVATATTTHAPSIPNALPTSLAQVPTDSSTTEQAGTKPPWAGTGWDFGEGGAAARDSLDAEDPSANTASNGQEPSQSSKGKGRAVEVEDAPDTGA